MAKMKTCGKKADFKLLSEDASRVVIGYEMTKVTGKNLYEWWEVYIYTTQKSQIALQDVKDAIINDINARTDEKILTGFVWTPEGGDPIPVWLSEENQINFSEAQRIAVMDPTAILPVTFKLGEQEDGTPIYHQFTTAEELTQFYLQAAAYKNQCLADGWTEKDSIDWAPYEALFPQQEQVNEPTE